MENLSIEDLLNSLHSKKDKTKSLPNNRDTWSRIANRDSFDELGLDGHELEEFLQEWIKDNPYN